MYGKMIDGFKGYYEEHLKHHHNNPWLIGLWGCDPGRFETQILCQQNGSAIEGTNRFEDLSTGEVWGPIRWPKNAYSVPEELNPPLTYNIGARVKAIGTTWWDWRNKHTVRLGFDIDSVIGHAAGVGVADEVIAAFSSLDLPFITILRSTRGLGRHIYIEFGDPYPITENHHEHAAVARSLLPTLTRMAREQGLNIDFEADKDVCGGVMWIHHVNATKENRGYEMVKQATGHLTAHDVPSNWRDHLTVVGGSRTKVTVRGYDAFGNETKGDELDDMSASTAKVPLDKEHEKVLDALEDTGYSTLWVHDHHLCQTHTLALKEVHERLGLKGLFETDAPGTDIGKPNCFMRPRLNGGWDVYRFGQGTHENDLWDTVGEWTHICFNVPPTFDQLMLSCGGTRHINADMGYVFSSLADCKEAIAALGAIKELPPRAEQDRIFSIWMREDGTPILIIEKKRGDKPIDFKGFVKTAKGWQTILNTSREISNNADEQSFNELDNIVRAVKTRNFNDNDSFSGTLTGWVIRDATGGWMSVPSEQVGNVVKRAGYKEVDIAKGEAILNAWELVNLPFKPEFPGDRKWNRNAPQLRVQPAKIDIDKVPIHPWWDRYLNHLGSDLDTYIEELDWPAEWNIKCGGDYLKVWIACMIRYPFDKLPYLFMWGPQETGKSMFYESIQLLMTRGVASADKALTSKEGYNGELLNCVLAYIDETNVATAGQESYNRLKAWSTGLTISIHAKFQQPYEAVNTCHFVQFANMLEAVPVMRGDKRITAIQIPPVVNPIPKGEFMDHLKDEAPQFLATLFNWEIPDAPSRLRMPVIETYSKTAAIEQNDNGLDNFIADNCFEIPGARVKFEVFYQNFLDSLSEVEQSQWNKRLVKSRLSAVLPVGRGPGNVDYVGNLTFEEDHPEGEPYKVVGRRLTQKGDENDSSENE